jgi:hypothetical protein
MIRTPRTRLTRLADEAGFAMPIVVAVSAVLLLVATAAVTSGLNATTRSNEDRQVKVSRQAADSGLELALFDLNTVIAGQALPCATRDAAGTYTMASYAASGWCPPVTQTLADGSTIQYQVSNEVTVPNTNPEQVVRRIVATGTYLGEQRRVYTELRATRGVAGFGIYGISAKEDILFENGARAGSTTNNVNVRTNGAIVMKDNSYVCGDVTPGPGKSVSTSGGATICPGKSTAPATTPLVFEDYDAEHNAAWTTNDNGRLGCGGGANKDACTQPSSVIWDSSKRELIVDNDATLTLSGNEYSFCRLNLKGNSRLFIAPRPASTPIKLYFASPSKCGGMTENVMIENGWGITNNNTDPTTLQFFVRGATTPLTRVNFKNTVVGSSSTPMMVYAPNSEVILENSAKLSGGLVGKTVHLKNGVEFNYDPNAVTPTGSTALVYQPTGHRECSPQAAGAPDSGC